MNNLHVPVGLLINLLLWGRHEDLGKLFRWLGDRFLGLDQPSRHRPACCKAAETIEVDARGEDIIAIDV